MKEFLTKNLVSLIVLALLVVLYLQRCTEPAPPAPVNTHDTLIVEKHIYHDSTIVSKPVYINHIDPTPIDIPTNMIPDSTYAGLRRQYDSLSAEYYSKNIFKDSISIDSIGYVSILDTAQRNRIIGRKWDYNIRERLITQTITNTIYPDPKLQVYVGLGVMGEQEKLVNGVEAGLLLKNKKDQIFGVSVNKAMGWPLEYTLSSYWKIKLHK